MSRIRTIKPEFPQSESMGRVSRDARLCFILLWTLADDSGRTRGNSRMLASLLFPYDDDAKDLISGWLDELHSEGCISLYEDEGGHYVEICKWFKHQKVDRSRIKDQELCPTPLDGTSSSEVGWSELIYKAYPRHEGRRKALEAIMAALRRIQKGETGQPVEATDAGRYLLDKVTTYARSPAGRRGSFTPHPTTWFNQGRYMDEEQEWFKEQEAPFVNRAEQVSRSNEASVAEAIASIHRKNGMDNTAAFGLSRQLGLRNQAGDPRIASVAANGRPGGTTIEGLLPGDKKLSS